MNETVKKIIVTAGLPIVLDVVTDALDDISLIHYRDEAVEKLEELAARTSWKLDDYAVEAVRPMLLDFSNIKAVNDIIIPWARTVIVDSDTKWDDKLLLPILDVISEKVAEEAAAEDLITE